MNGNVVLIPHEVTLRIGILDPIFEHGMGDIDYSMRACKLGIKVLIPGCYVGTCEINRLSQAVINKSFYEKLRFITSKKGLPLYSWFYMCWRHGGALWPIHFIWGYIKFMLFVKKTN